MLNADPWTVAKMMHRKIADLPTMPHVERGQAVITICANIFEQMQQLYPGSTGITIYVEALELAGVSFLQLQKDRP